MGRRLAVLAFISLAGCQTKDSKALRNPALAVERAPEVFKAELTTTQGTMVVEVHRAWAPNGADRFYNLVKIGFYDGTAFFRVIDGFMAQVGIHGNPFIAARWRDAAIPDDPPTGHSNTRGMVSFAHAGPNTRTTQVSFHFADNSFLDAKNFPPIGQVVSGLEVLDKLYRGYGDGPPDGNGPNQSEIQRRGNVYLWTDFRKLDYIRSARIVP